MLSHVVNQSRIYCSQTLGSAETSKFRADNDDTKTRFSPHREDQLKGMLSQLPHDMRSQFDKWIRILVKEEIESSHNNHASSYNNIKLRNLELRISNIISPLLTGDHIKGIGGTPVTVTLIDSLTKEEVKSGPEASGKVEILVIEAEDEDGRIEFEGKLVCHTEGKKSVHVNNLPLNLCKGTAVFPRVSFARNNKWTKISKVRLQAKFLDKFDGVHVKEAQTDPFYLRDRRNEAYKKHPIPSLDDDVWRLYNIAKKGTLVSDLIKKDINTVGDFIACLFRDPQRLKMIFDDANHAKSLKVTIKHAQKCPAIFMYRSSIDQRTEVIFNVSGEVLGLYLRGSFLSSDTHSETQKVDAQNLIMSSIEHWEDVVPFKDQDSLIKHLQSRTTLNLPSHNNLNVVIPHTTDHPHTHTNLTFPKSQSPKRTASEHAISNSPKQPRYYHPKLSPSTPSVGMDTTVHHKTNNLDTKLNNDDDVSMYLDLFDKWTIVCCAVGWISIITKLRKRRMTFCHQNTVLVVAAH